MTTTTARGREGVQAPARPRAARRAARIKESLVGWGFLTPNLLLMAVFLFLPIVWAVQLSFQETKGFGTPEWVGLDNYVKLVTDPVFWQSFGNTIVFTILTVPVVMIGGLGLAVLLNSVLPARGVFRTAIVLPMVISGVASAMVAVILFYESNGLINKVLAAVGLSPVAWQSQGVPAMISVVVVAIWLRIGFNMIIYLAGLQGISPEVYEAARIDGASRWQQFRSITVPLVGPSSFFLLIMNVIASFQVFDLIFVMTGGGPGNSTSVLVTYAYRNGFQIREQGYGAAIGIVILIITLIFTFIQWKTSRTRDLVE
ncbi:carbohydrate ABC transporter membrane protein 1, CUT1 family [Agromyces sp. CF514]|uniref:carbohydrate ABC transporter permease n=1 Tax=Agromyces sp. CF514 TaxID=1881031 RepID=UPI0008F22174|nr:sugar ABC transporter permease [Agromyces sp. CF514]SFR71357.1 carbohydrate ABC transporter membrane protein 1, CUT1 family [Agromyces sp. CF514]